MTTINGQEYAWGDLDVYAWGQRIGGLRGIEYKITQKQEHFYGAGRMPRSVQCGEYEPSGTLTVSQSELDAMARTASSKGYTHGILGVPLDIAVTYTVDGAVTTDLIRSAYISEMPKGMKPGDLQSEHALPFKALDIEYNVA